MTNATWTIAEPSLPALTYTYSFGAGLATALAVPAGGGLAVVSPPARPTEETFTSLEKHGPVKALIASNGFHHLGLRPWKERYPDAPIFAPAPAIQRIFKQSKMDGLRPVDEAKGLFERGLEIIDMPHYKTGEVLVRWPIEGGYAWYVTDVIMNFEKSPPGLFGAVFRWTRSAPGFRRNALAAFFMVKDKRALYAWINEQAEKTPPKLVLAAHGASLRPADPVGEIRAALT